MRPPFQVLYAEDNAVDADLTRRHFARCAPEFALEIVHCAADFMALARTGRHALLLIDQRLPDLDGLEVLKHLAQEGIRTPTVFVTAAGDGELVSQALRLGAEDYVPKRSGYLDVLTHHLRELVQRQRGAAGAPARATPRRVLLASDQADAAVLAQNLASQAAHLTVDIVTDTTAVLPRLGDSAVRYHLVLGDHHPPAVDGFALLAEIRRSGIHMPVILLGDAGYEEAIVAAFKLGAADYVFRQESHYAELALRIDLAVDRHDLALAHERAAAENAERQRTVAALRESEKQLNLALDAGRIGLWSWEVESGLTQFSSRWKAQIGYAEHEIRNDSSEWESRCDPDDLLKLQAMTARYLAAPWPDFTVEYRLRHKDGSWRWFMLRADLECDDAGRPVRMLGSQIDITELKQQQAELASTSARLQQLSRRLLEVQETERHHLARELHDEIGQVLTAAKIHLQSAALAPELQGLARQLEEPVAMLDRLLAQVRSLSLNLRPPLLDDFGLVRALRWLLQQPRESTGGPEVHLATDPALGRFDPALETACFRIAQEALTNALRHARAKTIQLTLGLQTGALRLGVRDDGVGFDAAAARRRSESGGSLGLLGMHERASLAGGTLTLLSVPGRGTEVEAVFPLSNLQKNF